MAADQTDFEARGDLILLCIDLRVSQRCSVAAIGDCDDGDFIERFVRNRVLECQVLPELAADLIHAMPENDAVGTGKVHVLEDAVPCLRCYVLDRV